MKAVILAAGKGTRMGDLTTGTPKPLLKIDNKTLLEWKMDILPRNCTEVILIVGYLGDKIRQYLGNEYKGMRLTYVNALPNGTGYALFAAKNLLDGPFIVMCGDDLYARSDIERCILYTHSILVHETSVRASGGKIVLSSGGDVVDIVEGTHEVGSMVWAGVYVLTPSVFLVPLVPKAPESTEFGLPQTLLQIKEPKMHAICTTAWHQVTTPADLIVSEGVLDAFR